MQNYTDPKLYDEIVKDWEYRFPKFQYPDYPIKQTKELKPKPKFPPDKV